MQAETKRKAYKATEQIGENEYTFHSRWEHIFARHLQTLVKTRTLLGWQYKPSMLSYYAKNKTNKVDFTFKVIYATGDEAYIMLRINRQANYDLKEIQRYYKDYRFIEFDKTFFIKNEDRLKENQNWIE